MPSLDELLAMAGGAGGLGSQVGIARGETPGQLTLPLEGLSNEELAELDRFAQGAVFAQSFPEWLRPFISPIGAAGAVANEASKAIPGAQNFIADILGEEQFRTGEATSDPSLDNIFSFLEGQRYGGADLIDMILSLMQRDSRFEPAGADTQTLIRG